MASLLDFDRGNPKLPRHFKPSLKDDEFETPNWLYNQLRIKYHISPDLDVFATKENTKCRNFFTISDNALEQEWILYGVNQKPYVVDVWMNHPHSLHAESAKKAYQQWQKWNMNIMSIFPANCCRTTYWHRYIENIAEYHAIRGTIRFLQHGKPSTDASRNAYMCVIWRKK